MKNFIKYLMVLAFISYEIFIYSALENSAIGYLHDKILGNTVPELKEFNAKLTALFRVKDPKIKITVKKDLLSFVNDTKKKLNYEIGAKKMTVAEIKAIKMALGMMRRKVIALQNFS